MEISFFTRHVLDSRHVQLKKSKAEELNDMGQPWLIEEAAGRGRDGAAKEDGASRGARADGGRGH